MQFPYSNAQSYPLPQGQTNIIWVESEDEARIRTRQLFPNSVMIMLDNNKPLAYRCVTDISGRAHPIEVFDLIPHKQEKEQEVHEEPQPAPEPEEPYQLSMEEYMQQQNDRIARLEDKVSTLSQPVEIVSTRKRGAKHESV